MPKITFSNENKAVDNNSFPTLKLDYQERALIVCIEPEPTVEFVHTLRAPQIGPDGRVVKEIKKNSKGEEYTATDMEFFGQHLCFGDFDVVSDKGVDPENCPTCRAAVDGEGIEAPKRRYAMHVLRYGLQPGTWTVREPFAVSCEAWVFADNRFNTLIDLAAEWGDLRKHDLKLGPCENKNFQKYDIQVAQNAQWYNGVKDEAEQKKRKEQAAEVYANNQAPDLSALIARKVDKTKALEDIQRVQERIEQAYGRTDSTPSISSATQSISDDVSEVFGGGRKASSEASQPDEAQATITPETAPETTPSKGAVKEMSIADIMADL